MRDYPLYQCNPVNDLALTPVIGRLNVIKLLPNLDVKRVLTLDEERVGLGSDVRLAILLFRNILPRTEEFGDQVAVGRGKMQAGQRRHRTVSLDHVKPKLGEACSQEGHASFVVSHKLADQVVIAVYARLRIEMSWGESRERSISSFGCNVRGPKRGAHSG